jgi:choline dehydrogenase-like flavoprotein
MVRNRMNDYDAIVIGAGAAGGIVACVLAEAGKSVLLLERGRPYDYADIPRDHLRNHRLSLYGQGMGPDLQGHPRVFAEPDGAARTVESPHLAGYNNNAMGVGGGTRVYGAQAWRFLAQDFRMASTYGVPEGSSLADWPVDHEEMEPFYDRAEWEIGCSGDGGANRFQTPRKRDYPMPPVPLNPGGAALKRGADSLGWNTFPLPLLINTTEFNGRPACIRCNMCVGFACPSDSKNGTQNTVIPRALATGGCTLQTRALAERIETDAHGNATGVTYLVEENGSIHRHAAQAKTIIVSAGAIESPRLLLNSASAMHPRGLGNAHDQVGRNLQGHLYPTAHGFMPDPVNDNLGPGASIATCQHSHGNPGVIGGGMLANDFIETPLFFWRSARAPNVPRWGLENKRWMRENYRRWIEVKGPIQEIPNPESRVTVDPSVRDKFGLPVARLSGVVHPESIRTALALREKAIQWLQASGAENIWSPDIAPRLSAGQHQAGTCRMGDDPRTSVTDRWGRVHGHDNLYVIDGSLHVTNGGFNPVLTIMALAFRCGEYITSL